VFENRVLRRIFGPKVEEVTGENCIMSSFIICKTRKYYYSNQIKENMDRGMYDAWELRNSIKNVVQKSAWKIRLRRPKYRC
jgi:hypothetical protein